jgi:geranylgeranyl diphosphate synthase type II
MDNSDTRRGKPSCHKQYNECLAILAGDGLLHYAFHVMSGEALRYAGKDLRPLRAMHVIAKKSGIAGMVYGQACDTENPAPPAGLKMNIDQNKTAAMFAAAMRAGAILGGADETAENASETFGYEFGMVFQILDDLADGDPTYTDKKGAEKITAEIKEKIRPYDKHGFFSALCDFIVKN